AEGITVSFLPPQIAEQFMAEENNRSLRTLLVGGDKLRDYVPRNYRLVNNYGPTENAVVATVFPLLHPRADIPIGKPIANTSLYVLDKNLNTQPVGVPGELYISGAGQALGYLNRPDLTSAAFVPNPFQPGKRMYKTGDLVSWLPDGNIRFLGRLDFQVKIRGFRIELGEIETAILGHQSVKNAVVITHREEPGNSYLCAYVVPADNRSWDKVVPVLREHLARSLPDYMIPAYFIHMETLPLNAAGKVNRGALREPEGSEHVATGVEFLAPRDETEQKLADIYGDLLRVEQVGIDDDFFRLGGHSLKATQLVGNIHKFLDVSLTLTEVFKTPTVRGLAQKVKEAAALPKTAAFAAIEQAPLQEYYPMSSGQRRMYLAQITAPENTSYNMPMMIELEGRLNRERLIAGLRQLVNRHESFRTSFLTIDTVPKQQILPRVQMEVEYFDLQGTGKGEKITELLETFIRPFDMKTPPHIRARLVKQEEHRHIMMLDMHHIVSDGVSMGIFTRELMDAYEGRDLPGPEFQYKDYAVWQEELSASGVLEGQEKYWLEVFAGELPVLDIHTDYPRPALQQFEGRSIAFGINETLTKKLKTIAAAQGATLYMMVLGLYNILLSRYGRVEDVIVGTPTAGRRDTALESIVGMFVNTLALRNFPAMEKPFSIGNLKKSAAPSPRGPQASRQDGFLEEVRKRTLEAFDNQDYQFEDIVETLELRRDLSRSPLFDTMFT
ncbi:MAG: AMP-binding protein, partial [bacterium]|nr:AMP-binding protein [bacterium]